MRHGIFAAVLGAGLLLAASPGLAEGRRATFDRLREEAEAALKVDDLATAEARLTAATALYPGHPGPLARLVSVQAMRGETAAALASLDAYAHLGLLLNMERPERAGLKADPAYAPIGARLAANAAPRGKVAWSLPIDGAPPLEGVAHDPASGRIFLSLVGGKAVLVGDRKRGFRPFTPPGAGVDAIFGMAWDAERGLLWAAEASGAPIPGSSGAPRTAIIALDGRTGALKASHPLPEDGVRRQFGDVILGPDGSVYATDSVAGGLYRLRPGAEDPERIATSEDWASPQGMVLLDGGVMVVADYATGLYRVDLANGEVTPVRAPPEVSLITIDGFSKAGEFVYATQNGVAPMRLLRLRLSADGREVTSVEVVASALAEADDVALGAVVGDQYLVTGRSGWAGFDGEGKASGPQGKPLLTAIALEP